MAKLKLASYESISASNKEVKDKDIKVAFYARVSTNHESQKEALGNQLEWCHKLRDTHPNWVIPDALLEDRGIYVDEGITGTQAKKRTNFLRAIDDGIHGVYQLLVVRDVSRFARNAEESLKYTHELKKYGVEVFFVNDGIWSKDPDGDLRLGIMAILAQDESRRISEKVLAGQSISRQNGVLYGTGNILGYNLVKRKDGQKRNTYIIDPVGAETVRMIFKMYLEDNYGVRKISSKLTELKRANASGEVRWSADKISRILDNRTYSGYIGYNKSKCTSFLEHTRVKTNKNTIQYIKGDFEPIIDDSIWQEAQALKNKRTQQVQEFTYGKNPSNDKWGKKIRCSCNGSSYKRFKWRTNEGSGEECFGYQCYNIIRHRKRDFVVAQGLSGEGYCNVPSIAQWKLDFQLRLILQKVWANPDKTMKELMDAIEENYSDYDEKAIEMENARLLREETRLHARMDRLLETLLDGLITKEQFSRTKEEIDNKLNEIKARIDEITGRDKLINDAGNREALFDAIRISLSETASLDTKFIDEEIVDNIVERVVPYEDNTFKWYLNFSADESDVFDENDFAEYDSFTINFEQARSYRKQFGNFIRARQWKDINVMVYIRVAN